ncbi:MAG TPA: hypothetical protein VED40_19345 [Azospirillaceae bacterium]|nr:hypothetical protein [Azospirillaceae bacterium]
MDRLNQALSRLDHAIGRLDAAIAARLARPGADRGELERALAEARAGETAARQAVDAVSTRLDGAIDRLRAVLEE